MIRLYIIKIAFVIFVLGITSCLEDPECFKEDTTIAADPNSIEMNWIEVEGGSFEMGCTAEQSEEVVYCFSNELPRHTVSLDSYMIAQYEVTNEQFIKFLNSHVLDFCRKPVRSSVIDSTILIIYDESSKIELVNGVYTINDSLVNHPITGINWIGAKTFCEWVGGRLPTEAEWEFAARGGNKSNGYVYSGSNDINEVAILDDDDSNKFILTEVGAFPPNELGIYDMSGNVYEFCNDYYDEFYYKEDSVHNPLGADSGDNRIIRGNRVAYRDNISDPRFDSGCRCVKDIQ